jgi:uncharacterized membrane protein YbjE (DUF340 family)
MPSEAGQVVMQSVLFFLGAGILAGFLLRKRLLILHFSDKAASWAVYLLLFTLGLGTGLNPDILSALGLSGLFALILSLAAIMGSILLIWPVYRLFFAPSAPRASEGKNHGQP